MHMFVREVLGLQFHSFGQFVCKIVYDYTPLVR